MQPGERLVTLIDGSVVTNYSEEHRAECEARAVLAIPTKDRRHRYLWGYTDPYTKKPVKGVLQQRGEDAAKELEQLIWAVWEHRQRLKAGGK